MNLKAAIEMLQKIDKFHSRHELKLYVPVHRPGSIGGTPCAEVTGIYAGIDWDKGKVLVMVDPVVTSLTQQEVDTILESARQGQSWHAYQIHKKLSDKIKSLEDEIKRLSSPHQVNQDVPTNEQS